MTMCNVKLPHLQDAIKANEPEPEAFVSVEREMANAFGDVHPEIVAAPAPAAVEPDAKADSD